MKSAPSTQIHSALQSPRTQASYEEEAAFMPFSAFRKTHHKMVAYMTNTMQTFGQLQRRTHSVRKSNNKPRISILPLTRQKVRVGQRGWRRRQSRGTADCNFRPSPHQSPDSPKISRSKQFTQFFTMLTFMHNKTKKSSYKLQILIEQLALYFGKHKQKHFYKQIVEIVNYSRTVRAALFQNQTLPYQILKNCQGELSKLFFSVCFQIYLYKTNQLNFVQLAFVHRDIQYYARRLGMLSLALVTCMDMGKVSLDFFDFEKAQECYSKAVKLSVKLGDKYREQLSIDRLGMCEYYRGDLMAANFYHKSVDRLSSYNKVRILEHYSNQKQILKILEEKTKEKSHEEQVKSQFFRVNKENIEFNFDQTSLDSEFTQKNYECFRHSLKDMIKVNSLRKKVPMIKTALDKVRKIGEKKYKGKDYLVPKASKFYARNDKSQQQFMQSHRSYNRNNVVYQSAKIDKHCKIIDQIINFLETDHKNYVKPINEERESILSQEN